MAPVTRASRTDSHVRDFYDRGGGDRMFSDASLTPPVADYLRREESFVFTVAEELGSKHLFEVGCGYGRYLACAEARHIDYDGVDLVSALVEAGRRRLTGSPRTRQKLHIGSCREVASLFEREGLLERARELLVLFPFNCFGNVAEPERVLRSLRLTGARVVVSGFQVAAPATHLRRDYYENNHFTSLQVRVEEAGVLFESAEGLHSWAYTRAELERQFTAAGFTPVRFELLGEVGQAHLFDVAATGA